MNRTEKRELGKTGLAVSRLSLGTAALGMKYGIPSQDIPDQPDWDNGLEVVEQAVKSGINFFDTAPGYGFGEELLGEALGKMNECVIATKVAIPRNDERLSDQEKFRGYIRDSVEKSLHNLRRDRLDVLQIHNANIDMLQSEYLIEALIEVKEDGLVDFIGATVYGRESALYSLEIDHIDVVQIAYSVLDQQTQEQFITQAAMREVGVYNRSALLKGVLTKRLLSLNDSFYDPIRIMVFRLKDELGLSWDELPVFAMRFCLSNNLLCSTLTGACNLEELQQAVSATEMDVLTDEELKICSKFSLTEDRLIDPSQWSN